MANYSQKIQTTVTNADGASGLNGYGTASGNSRIDLDQSFAASTTNSAITLAFTLANLQAIALVSDKGCTIKTNGTGTADVQTVSISGTPTGGTVQLEYGGKIASIAFNASAATVQAALQALSSIGSGNITCTGGPLPGTPVVCTFAGSLATGSRALLNAGSGALTGGTSPTVTVTHTTSGFPSDTITLTAGVPVVWQAGVGQVCPFTADVTTAFVTNTAAQNLKIKGLSS